MENQFKNTRLNKNQLKNTLYEILKKCIKKGRVHAHPFHSDYFILKGSNTQKHAI